MSSPNLNILTLFGSVLAYVSGYLFAIDEQVYTQTGTSIVVQQVSFQFPHMLLCLIYNCVRYDDDDDVSCRLGHGHCVLAVPWCLDQFWGRHGDSTECSHNECLTSEW